jgi:hypothetical protein
MRWTRHATTVTAAMTLLAGCAASSQGSEVATLGGQAESPNPQRSRDPERAFLRFAQCMRDHGVEVGDPEGPDGEGEGIALVGEGVEPEELSEADAACRHLLPEGTFRPPDPSPQEQAALHDRLVRFARCMREHGIDLPDPDPDAGGFINTPGDAAAPDPTDPGFIEAEEACSRFMPEAELSAGGQEGTP